jgi:hypothetical protein
MGANRKKRMAHRHYRWGDGVGRATALLCAIRADRIAILDKNGDSAKRSSRKGRRERWA